MKKEIKKRGGKRAGAGAKSKYGEPTSTIAFRVPNSKKIELKKIIKKHLKKWETIKT
jgi:hypothetical protein